MTKAELYYHFALHKRAEQDDVNRQLQWKASGALALAVALIGLTTPTISEWGVESWIPAGALTAAFCFTAYYARCALRLQKFAIKPSVAELGTLVHTDEDDAENDVLEEDVLFEWIADAVGSALEENTPILENKARNVSKAAWALATETFALMALIATLAA